MALTTLADVYERLEEPGKAKALLLEPPAVAREHEDVRYASEMGRRLEQFAPVEGN